MPDDPTGLLARLVTDPNPPPFAVLRREEGPGVEVFAGDLVDVPTLADIPENGGTGAQVLALVPYRQVVERGFVCHDDRLPLRCLVIRQREVLDLDAALGLLFMVVDEELKMMSAICAEGGQVLGPRLKQMSALTPTEYLLRGHSALDVRDVLRETMFAPTVTGSPIRNAARVIARHESTPRGYYSGVLALLGRDADGRQTLDAPILIRTAHLDPDGGIRVPVGATLVRSSRPEHEVAETHAKAAAVLRALRGEPAPPPAPRLVDHPGVDRGLADRNRTLARFWLDPQTDRPLPALHGHRALLVDAEDAWTAMLAHQLRRLGLRTEVRAWDEDPDPSAADLLVAGPGPGDPRDPDDPDDPRMAALRTLIGARLTAGRPLLACV